MGSGTSRYWETCFCKKLVDTIFPTRSGGIADANIDAVKNAEAFAELSLCLDDKCLSLIFRGAKVDGGKTLSIRVLNEHY